MRPARRRTKREIKGLFYGETSRRQGEQPMRGAADRVWNSSTGRAAVLSFLRTPGRGHRLSIPVGRARAGKRVEAVFVKVYRVIAGNRVVLAVDEASGTVYTGVPLSRRKA